jgi:Nucleotidyl transferase AbiEii toxin, Type IV TA system
VNLASQIAELKDRGFNAEQAEVITLMRIAAGVVFRAFPNSFLLFGGATLVMFHNSLRHSGDLDLLSRTDERPAPKDVQSALEFGLADSAEALGIGPLQFEHQSEGADGKVWIKDKDGKVLFRLDLSRFFGSVLESEVVEHEIAIEDYIIAKVKSASRDLLLFQKAECFLQRKIIKTRDAFDIRLLMNSGAALSDNLKNHLTDTLMSDEIEAEDILKKIDQVDTKRCGQELRTVLPPDVFENLAKEEFKPLRDALHNLYSDWL